MKKHIGFATAFALFATGGLLCAQPDEEAYPSGTKSSQEAEQSSTIDEPSGSDTSMPANPIISSPAAQATSSETNAAATALDQSETIITVSRSFTNQPNSVTIIGSVNSDQEKQQVETALQQALPGRTINNQLMVSQQQQGITEPAGAEKSSTNTLELPSWGASTNQATTNSVP